jgi:SAM-dependent methyltransferase
MSSTTELDRREFLKAALALAALLRSPAALAAALDDPGNFKAIYLDAARRKEFRPFIENVFHLYPEDKFEALILDSARKYATDEEIYKAVVAGLEDIKSPLAPLTYMLPALRKQKKEMTDQMLALMGKQTSVKGYLEIGTTGRYYSHLKGKASIAGPHYFLNDVAPTYSPADIAERRSLSKLGAFFPMGDYDPVGAGKIPDASLELVANLIGFHHCPTERLEAFVGSIGRVLKPGGRLIVRDHDCDTPAQTTLVALAHDVFNAGLKLTWKDNHDQVRLFRSIRDWSAYLEARGFKKEEKALAQTGDPTKNLLLSFLKT